MTQGKLIRWAHVQDGDNAFADQLPELLAGDRLKVVEPVEVATNNAFDFGDVAFRNSPYRAENVEDAVVGQRVINEFALTPRFQKSRASQVL